MSLGRLIGDKGLEKKGGEQREGLPPSPTKAIEKGEYVDFIDLLPKKPNLEEPSISDLAEWL